MGFAGKGFPGGSNTAKYELSGDGRAYGAETGVRVRINIVCGSVTVVFIE
jgi:hypothetical protein